MFTDIKTTGPTPFRAALTWAYAMTLGQRGVALVLTFILAALLGPGHFGTVAMAMAYIVFIEMFVAQGMTTAVIQRKDLTSEHLDAVFWLTLGAGIALAGLSLASSRWWATVNDLPVLAPVIAVLSLSIPIKGLTVVQHALLQRNMDFRNLALLGGVSSVVGGALGVTMALLGFGVWSLVAQQLVNTALATAIMWIVSDWRPRLRFSLRHVRELLGFSGGAFAAQLGAYLASHSDAILMGLFFGPVAVGLYRLADRLMRTLLEIATRSIQVVALPHFSRFQDDPADLRVAVLSCIRLSATLTLPAMALLAGVSDPLIAVLGSEWAAASAVLKVVVVLGMAKAVVLFNGPLLFALSRPRIVARLVWAVGLATACGIVGAGTLMKGAVVEYQIMTVAVTRVAIFTIPYVVACLIITHRLCGIPAPRLAAAVAPGVASALAAIAVAAALSHVRSVTALPAVAELIVVGLPSAIASTFVLLILDRRLRQTSVKAIRAAAAFVAPGSRLEISKPDPAPRSGGRPEAAVIDS